MTSQTMSLKERLQNDMKDAMRAKDKARLGVIRLINADIKQKEVDERITVNDEQVIAILDKMVKRRRDSIAQYEAAQRQDLADQEKFEIGVIQEYLPAALSEDELTKLVEQAIAQSDATSPKDMGTVMAILRPQVQGRCDMGKVSQAVKSRLAG